MEWAYNGHYEAADFEMEATSPPSPASSNKEECKTTEWTEEPLVENPFAAMNHILTPFTQYTSLVALQHPDPQSLSSPPLKDQVYAPNSLHLHCNKCDSGQFAAIPVL
jgi:hypothetical protein